MNVEAVNSASNLASSVKLTWVSVLCTRSDSTYYLQFVGCCWPAVLHIVFLPGVGGGCGSHTLVLLHVLSECGASVLSEAAFSRLELFQPLLVGAGSRIWAWFPALVLLYCVNKAYIRRFWACRQFWLRHIHMLVRFTEFRDVVVLESKRGFLLDACHFAHLQVREVVESGLVICLLGWSFDTVVPEPPKALEIGGGRIMHFIAGGFFALHGRHRCNKHFISIKLKFNLSTLSN